MAEAFYWFLNMNIVASLCGLVILLLRRVRRIPRRLICWLWLIPALRVLLPFGAETRGKRLISRSVIPYRIPKVRSRAQVRTIQTRPPQVKTLYCPDSAKVSGS